MKRFLWIILGFVLIASIVTCSSQGSARPRGPIVGEYTTDLLIIGGGWAGLTAAASAGEAGINTVVLEKNEVIGGSTAFLVGTAYNGFWPGSPNHDLDQSYNVYQNYIRYNSRGKNVRILFNEVPNNMRWLSDHGVSMPPNSGFFLETGAQALNIFTRILNGMPSVRILTGSPATDLIVENGVVKGAIANSSEGRIRVNAKYTIIATGPIVGDPELLKKHVPWLGEGYEVKGAPGRTGDGIRLAQQVNARIDALLMVDTESGWITGTSEGYYYPSMMQPGQERQLTLHHLIKLGVLRVNFQGKRFMDESIFPFHKEMWSMALNNNMYWAIFDQNLINSLRTRGIDDMGFSRLMFPALPNNNPRLENIDAAIQMAIDGGNAVRADTIEELAQKMGVDAGNLRATIARYNDLAQNGYDDDLLKNPRLLHNYNPPFYALRAVHVILSTNGGIQSDENFNVIDVNMNPIPGLYVAGVLVGSQSGETYPMEVQAGASTGFGMSAGRIIVRNIAAELRR